MGNNCVPEILDLLGKVDCLLDMVENFDETFEEFSNNEEFLEIIGSANSFQSMKNISLLKSILHSITAILMEASRAQALKYQKSDGPTMHPSAHKSISDFIKKTVKDLEDSSDIPQKEEQEQDQQQQQRKYTTEENVDKESNKDRQERTIAEKKIIELEKEKRRTEEKQNKHLSNAMDYFKDKFQKDEDDEQ